MCHLCDQATSWIKEIESRTHDFDFMYGHDLLYVWSVKVHDVDKYIIREAGKRAPGYQVRMNHNGKFTGRSIHGTHITFNKELNEAMKNALGNYIIEKELV